MTQYKCRHIDKVARKEASAAAFKTKLTSAFCHSVPQGGNHSDESNTATSSGLSIQTRLVAKIPSVGYVGSTLSSQRSTPSNAVDWQGFTCQLTGKNLGRASSCRLCGFCPLQSGKQPKLHSRLVGFHMSLDEQNSGRTLTCRVCGFCPLQSGKQPQ